MSEWRSRLGWPTLRADAERAGGPLARWWELGGYGGLLLVAAVMRLWDLGSRAMHHDESLHAFYSWDLAQGNGFSHLPMMHGPFQFEASAAVLFVFGDNDYTARLLYALFGTVLVGLPFLFRRRLGNLGALIVAGLLAFSPTMLYFSRFSRNDILMAVWTLGLVIAIWRYIDEGKNRYLYIGSALLALAFATKETTYLLTMVLGLFLALLIVPDIWAEVGKSVKTAASASPRAAMRMFAEAWPGLREGLKRSVATRPGALLVLMVTLSLPQWSAMIGWFQDTPLLGWSGLVLAGDEGGRIGAPSGGGLLIAVLLVAALLWLSVSLGARWSWSVWWRAALIFYVIWALLYSTFFFNLDGIGSGIWGSLGYWVVQQGEARGGQPWYYYFVLTSIYEFLPLVIGVIAAVYYLRRNDVFGLFLVFWSVATFVMYTAASEKMPWLLVNITLPLILLSGKFLGEVIRGIQWRRLMSGGGVLVLPGVPVMLVLLWSLAFFEGGTGTIADVLTPAALGTALLGMVAVGVYLARSSGVGNTAAFATVPLVLVLLALSIRTGALASYRNGDTPVEMLVYTQTSPDITRIAKEIELRNDDAEQEAGVSVSVDQTSGFTWPWAWYLRNYSQVDFPSYTDTPLAEAPDSSVLLVHSNNRESTEEVLQEDFGEGERVKLRWWFPEDTYRDLTLRKFFGGFVDRQAWRTAMDYFLYREGVRDRIGSEDAYVYFSEGFP